MKTKCCHVGRFGFHGHRELHGLRGLRGHCVLLGLHGHIGNREN